MSNLNELYQALEILTNNGLNTDEVVKRICAEEGRIASEEAASALKAAAEKSLSGLGHDVSFRVVYHSGSAMADVSVEPDFAASGEREEKIREDAASNLTPAISGSRKRLRVTFPDGKVICERRAWETMARTIERIGPERVAQMVIIRCGVPLVDTSHSSVQYARAQHRIAGGFFLMTCSSTASKAADLRAISSALGLGLKVEEI